MELINGPRNQGTSGMAYFTIEKDKEIFAKGPVGKFFQQIHLGKL